jgi:DNA-binding HxlR family transcriptional regulator
MLAAVGCRLLPGARRHVPGQLLGRISDKWVALVLAALGSDGPRPGTDCVGEPRAMRYSELSRRLAGVSQKMLT